MDKTILYSASWDLTIKVWRLSDSNCLESISAHDDAVYSVEGNTLLKQEFAVTSLAVDPHREHSVWRVIGRDSEFLEEREAVRARKGDEGAQAGSAVHGVGGEFVVQRVGGQNDIHVEEGGRYSHVPVGADGVRWIGEVLGGDTGQGNIGERR
ncbi:hypothetical protein K1719_008971 [Acacia pycnantha]|nr:hypothetical protein K1719_008971 [Acacia pycnantha]